MSALAGLISYLEAEERSALAAGCLVSCEPANRGQKQGHLGKGQVNKYMAIR